ncbi:winged helix-turn-helix domain-containing protein [Thermincola potens]|uniref:Putative transcriptional regulator, ModE family n=1 Tax=Thermincola potens (strain JR) TaxID=635013 RepID=D5X9H6_THEPJ|nr:LysR family transcriptional regulator [Thermincola potens]ADG83080.1 putative transcriptional regulator, ModE family [Thermincola potens JR]
MAENKDVTGQTRLQPRSKIWIEAQGEVVFGGGRAALFQAIEETGSIRQAANKLGMSYRAAWGKIKATEERLGMALLEKHAGGHQSGATLTPEAKELLKIYREFKNDSDALVDELFARHFSKFLAK